MTKGFSVCGIEGGSQSGLGMTVSQGILREILP
jgi:hypothetical protein